MDNNYYDSEISPLNVTISLPGGNLEVITIADLDNWYLYAVEVSIIYASQLGASLMLLLVVATITDAHRRRTKMFAMNISALLLNFIRTLLGCLYFTGYASESYIYFTGSYDLVPKSEFNVQIAASIIMLLLLATVLACLTMQIHVILITVKKLYRWSVMFLSLIISALALGFRIWYSDINITAILNETSDAAFDTISYYKIIVTALAILWFSVIFVIQLGHTVLRRRKMGIKKLGPMEILLIMGGQTMVIPAAFSAMGFLPTGLPVMDSLTITLVTIFLPLSSLWANAIVDSRRTQAEVNQAHHIGFSDTHNTGRSFSSSLAKPLLGSLTFITRKLSGKKSNDNNVAYIDEAGATSQLKKMEKDLEKQGL